MTPAEELKALTAELGFVQQQPVVDTTRASAIEAEMKRVQKTLGTDDPADDAPGPVETTEAPQVEQAVPDKPARRKATDSEG